VLSLTLFEKTPISSLFENYDDQIETHTISNQLNLLESNRTVLILDYY